MFCPVFLLVFFFVQHFNQVATTKSLLADPSLAFGLNFLQTIKDKVNGLVSPLNIILAYQLLSEGSAGLTKKQIRKTLQLSEIPEDRISEASEKFIKEYDAIEKHESNRNFSTSIGNLLVIKENIEVLSDYLKLAREKYLATLKSDNFMSQEFVNYVNSWVTEKTRKMITKVLTEIPDQDTVMMLISTIFFKGQWKQAFDKNLTQNIDFFNSDGSKTKVPMMLCKSKNNKIRRVKSKNVSLIEIPYFGNVSLIVMQPDHGSFDKFISKLNPRELGRLVDLFSTSEPSSVDKLRFPKFKFEAKYMLDKILPEMGMKTPFTQSAEFPKITKSDQIFIGSSLHKTVIEVDEEGTKASAVTQIEIQPKSFSPPYIVNHPFLFIVRDNLYGVILFMGYVKDMKFMMKNV